jgi:DNA-binding MarR family transcriptional regulator
VSEHHDAPDRATTADDVLQALLHLGASASRLTVAWRQQLGVSANAYVCLVHLVEDGPHSGAELARRVGISSASMKELLDGLERDGLIVRRADPRDRRKHLAYPSKRLLAEGARMCEPLLEELARELRTTRSPRRAERAIDAIELLGRAIEGSLVAGRD